MSDLARALAPLTRKLRMLAGRAVLSMLSDAVSVQIKGLDGEVRDGAELFQQYGFRSRPLKGAEGILLSLGGNRDHTVIICMDDRRYQLDLLQDGEAAMYDDEGKKVHLTQNGIVIEGAGKPITIHAPTININGNTFITGNAAVSGGATGSFTTPTGTTVFVQDGIVTNIY